IRTILGRTFEREGWYVETAKDGIEAKEKLEGNAFDVIVSDINMVGYGGLQILRSIHERTPDVPVVLMTGKPSVDSAIRAIDFDVFRYLVKPVRNDTIVDAIGLALKRRRGGAPDEEPAEPIAVPTE